jgi:hypothetical protein
MVISVRSLALLPALSTASESWQTFQVYWNLLDSLVNAHLEATRKLPSSGAVLTCGDTTRYNLSGTTGEQRQAEELLKERLSTGASLSFGLVAVSEDRDLLAYTHEFALRDIMEAPERTWVDAKLPLYLDESGQHVADVVVSVVAHQALRRLWQQGRH